MALRAETLRFLADAAVWEWFVTLTFRHNVSDGAARRAFRGWTRTMARDVYRSHLRIGWVHAPQRRGVQHVHALVAAHPELHEAAVDAAALAAGWTRGTVDVQPVTEPIGAVDYMLDHTDLTEADIRHGWDLNVACDRRPRCRRRGLACRFAPGAWST